MADTLKGRLSCPVCGDAHLNAQADGTTRCSACNRLLVYVPGHYAVHGGGESSKSYAEGFNDGYIAGYDSGRIETS